MLCVLIPESVFFLVVVAFLVSLFPYVHESSEIQAECWSCLQHSGAEVVVR